MKKILLSQGKFALVDDEDYEKIVSHPYKWCAHYSKSTETYYASTHFKKTNGLFGTVDMHRFILNLKNRKLFVDHINHDTLDNRRENLRTVTHQQNLFNQRKTLHTSSRYKGVCFDKEHKKWRAKIMFNRKAIQLGRFDNEIDAAKAYNQKAKELFGEYACLNIFKKSYETKRLSKNR